jgi:hypothetical protein
MATSTPYLVISKEYVVLKSIAGIEGKRSAKTGRNSPTFQFLPHLLRRTHEQGVWVYLSFCMLMASAK